MESQALRNPASAQKNRLQSHQYEPVFQETDAGVHYSRLNVSGGFVGEVPVLAYSWHNGLCLERARDRKGQSTHPCIHESITRRSVAHDKNLAYQARTCRAKTELNRHVESLAHIFSPASPELLEQRALLKRVDTKFICHRESLPSVLTPLQASYQAALSGSTMDAPYRTIYLDTEEHRCLTDHHRGRRPRFKVRIRHHLARELTYLEVKVKGSKGKTAKERIQLPFSTEELSPEQLTEALKGYPEIPAEDLRPRMWIEFNRIMLVGIEQEERITIDTNLVFRDQQGKKSLSDLAVLEVKQRKQSHQSPSMKALRSRQYVQLSLSKYVTGAQLLWPEIPLNRYKLNLREIRRMTAC